MAEESNKERVLKMLWRNYESQVAATRRYIDRVTIVVGATIGAIGIVVKYGESSFLDNPNAIWAGIVSLVTLAFAFTVAGFAWFPRYTEQPSGTDVDDFWCYLVDVNDDQSCATVMADLCKAIKAERDATRWVATLFTVCMVLCAISLIAAIAAEMFAS